MSSQRPPDTFETVSSSAAGTDSVAASDGHTGHALTAWLTSAVASVSGGFREVSDRSGVRIDRLRLLASGLGRCSRYEVDRVSMATGYPKPETASSSTADLALDATEETLLAATERPLLSSMDDLTGWLSDVRTLKRGRKVPRARLAQALNISMSTVARWEKGAGLLPRPDQLAAIAKLCRAPEPIIDFEVPASMRRQERVVAAEAATVSEEILWTGRALSALFAPVAVRERNAEIFLARFGGQGGASSTLQEIGNRFGMTRERIRQIVEKQLSYIALIEPRTERFDDLEAACSRVGLQSLSGAEIELRDILGGALTLEGAQDYGAVVLGRSRLLSIVTGSSVGPFVTPMAAPWLAAASSIIKRLVRFSGAAQVNLAYGLLVRDLGGYVDYETFRSGIEQLTDFSWIDGEKTWCWLGPDRSANRILEWSTAILAGAGRPLDVEIIFGGLVRMSRTRPGTYEDAGVIPPVGVVRNLLALAPHLECQQHDDFKLRPTVVADIPRGSAAEAIVTALRSRAGIASRSELRAELVDGAGMNPITFSVGLATSPLLRQVDRSLYAIRGWPIDIGRLAAASESSPINTSIEVAPGRHEVTWTISLTDAGLASGATHLPVRAVPHLPEGEYRHTMDSVRVIHGDGARILGLPKLAMALGIAAGQPFKVSFNIAERRIDINTNPS